MRKKTVLQKLLILFMLITTISAHAEGDPNVYDNITFEFKKDSLIMNIGAENIEIERSKIQEGPGTFKLHANISQAKMPVERGVIEKLKLNIYNENEGEECGESPEGACLCLQELPKTLVEKGLLNVSFGSMECQDGKTFRDIIAENNNLYLEINIEFRNSEGILEPAVIKPRIHFGTVPFAVKSDYAVHANDALVCEVAAHSAYTHRAAADANLYKPSDQVGYFEFETPIYVSSVDDPVGAWIQWNPVGEKDEDNSLRICRDPRSTVEGSTQLSFLTLDSNVTTMTGHNYIQKSLRVNGSTDNNDFSEADAYNQDDNSFVQFFATLWVKFKAVFESDVIVKGNEVVEGTSTVGQTLTVKGHSNLNGNATVDQTLTVKGDSTFPSIFTSPFTWSFASGFVVPMPTYPLL